MIKQDQLAFDVKLYDVCPNKDPFPFQLAAKKRTLAYSLKH